MQIVLSAEKNNECVFHIIIPDIASERKIDIFEMSNILEQHNYFTSAIKVLRSYKTKTAGAIELGSNTTLAPPRKKIINTILKS